MAVLLNTTSTLKERAEIMVKDKDPSGEKWPSRHQISIGVPGVVANAINLSMGQINSAVGNGVLIFARLVEKPPRSQ